MRRNICLDSFRDTHPIPRCLNLHSTRSQRGMFCSIRTWSTTFKLQHHLWELGLVFLLWGGGAKYMSIQFSPTKQWKTDECHRKLKKNVAKSRKATENWSTAVEKTMNRIENRRKHVDKLDERHGKLKQNHGKTVENHRKWLGKLWVWPEYFFDPNIFFDSWGIFFLILIFFLIRLPFRCLRPTLPRLHAAPCLPQEAGRDHSATDLQPRALQGLGADDHFHGNSSTERARPAWRRRCQHISRWKKIGRWWGREWLNQALAIGTHACTHLLRKILSNYWCGRHRNVRKHFSKTWQENLVDPTWEIVRSNLSMSLLEGSTSSDAAQSDCENRTVVWCEKRLRNCLKNVVPVLGLAGCHQWK